MFFVFESTVTMTSLPVVNKHFRVLCFVTQRAGESTMIFMCVSENDASQIGNEIAGATQPSAQRLNRLFGLRTRIDDRQRIFSDQVDVDRADIKRRWYRDRDDAHQESNCRLPISNCQIWQSAI